MCSTGGPFRDTAAVLGRICFLPLPCAEPLGVMAGCTRPWLSPYDTDVILRAASKSIRPRPTKPSAATALHSAKWLTLRSSPRSAASSPRHIWVGRQPWLSLFVQAPWLQLPAMPRWGTFSHSITTKQYLLQPPTHFCSTVDGGVFTQRQRPHF